MKDLVTGDLHLVDAESEQYRFGVFDVLHEQLDKAQEPMRVVVAGDLSDAKDNHPARLVNKIYDSFKKLAQHTNCDSVIITVGNHDYPDVPSNAFWRFLDAIEGVTYLTEITTIDNTLFLPNTRNHTEDWKGITFSDYKRVYLHQSFLGARVSDGYSMKSGIDPKLFDKMNGLALGADIHIHQRAAKNYISIGAPARLRFGDSYRPSVLIVDKQDNIERIFTNIIEKEKVIVRNKADIAKISTELRSKVFIDSDDSDSIEDIEALLSKQDNIEGVVTMLDKTSIVDDSTAHIDGAKLPETLGEQWDRYCTMTKKAGKITELGSRLLEQ